MPKSLSLTRITNVLLFATILLAACSKKSNSPAPTLSFSTHSISMAALTGSMDTVKVSSTTNWVISSNQTWLSVSTSYGDGNSAIVLTGATNSGNASRRTATLTITASGAPADTVNVIQDAGVIIVAGNSSGTSGSGLNELNRPSGISLDAQNNLYIADAFNSRVVEWGPGASQGVVVAGNGTLGSSLSQLSIPEAVFVDPSGNVYVSDANLNYRVVKWAPGATQGVVVAGNGTDGAGLNQLAWPTALWVDPNSNIYVADLLDNRVTMWAPGATQGTLVAGNGVNGSGLNQLSDPQGTYVDAAGNIYIGDEGNSRVVKWALGASQGTIVAGTGVEGSDLNQLSIPYGIFIDKAGNMYIADGGNNRVVKWAPGASAGTMVAGDATLGPSTAPTHLNTPNSVWVDAAGYIYVADTFNNRVVRWAQ